MTTSKQYPMPALTEEQRQGLVKRLIRFRKNIQAARDANMQTEADESDDLIAQITLAALTAEPHIEIHRARIGYTFITRKPEMDLGSCVIGYNAPPVPVLKPIELPKAIQQHEACKYGLESSDAYGLHWGSKEMLRQCIEAIRTTGYEVNL